MTREEKKHIISLKLKLQGKQGAWLGIQFRNYVLFHFIFKITSGAIM